MASANVSVKGCETDIIECSCSVETVILASVSVTVTLKNASVR